MLSNVSTSTRLKAVPVYSLQELALVSSYFAGVDLADEFRVLVDEPCFTQHVRRRVLELLQHHHRHHHLPFHYHYHHRTN